MSDYKIIRLYKTNYKNVLNRSYGSVDIRPIEDQLIDEINIAKESLDNFNIEYSNNIICMVSIISNMSLKEALYETNIIFEQTHDLLQQLPMAKFEDCKGAGYVLDLNKNILMANKKQELPKKTFMNIFQISYGPYDQINMQQYIAAGRNDELVKAYLRSINWYQKSLNQSHKYLNFLFKWISFETLAKTKEKESIVPKLCLIIGFPQKNDIYKISNNLILRLNKIKNYKIWRKNFNKYLNDCREMRNSIVHSGFKEKDIVLEDLERNISVCSIVHGRLIFYMERLILKGIDSLNEAWDLMTHEFELNTNLIKDVEKKIIFDMEKESV